MQTGESLRTSALGFLVLTAVVILGLSLSKSSSISTAQVKPEDLVLQVADYNAPGITTQQDDAKRFNRNKRHDHQSGEVIKEVDYPVERIWSSHWSRGIQAIPAAQSDLIVIGSVVNCAAYLSTDKTGVYSEFDIRVEEVLKDSQEPGAVHSMISVERFGGAVRFPSGAIQKYRSSGQGMPLKGRLYVWFLKTIPEDDDFSLLTAYEIRSGRIVPLDGASQQGNEPLIFDLYRDASADLFLTNIRKAIIDTSRK